MSKGLFTRRNVLKGTGAAMLSIAASGTSGMTAEAQDTKKDAPEPGVETRAQRLAWWQAARFGMFIKGSGCLYEGHQRKRAEA